MEIAEYEKSSMLKKLTNYVVFEDILKIVRAESIKDPVTILRQVLNNRKKLAFE